MLIIIQKISLKSKIFIIIFVYRLFISLVIHEIQNISCFEYLLSRIYGRHYEAKYKLFYAV